MILLYIYCFLGITSLSDINYYIKKDKSELKEFIAKHLFERKPFYDMSTYKIDCSDNKTIDDVCEEIINTFN